MELSSGQRFVSSIGNIEKAMQDLSLWADQVNRADLGRTIFHINFCQCYQISKSWGHPFRKQNSMMVLVYSCKN